MKIKVGLNATLEQVLRERAGAVDDGTRLEIEFSHWSELRGVFEAMDIGNLWVLYALSFMGSGKVGLKEYGQLPAWVKDQVKSSEAIEVLKRLVSSVLAFPSTKELLQSEFHDEIKVCVRFLNFGISFKVKGGNLMSTLVSSSEE